MSKRTDRMLQMPLKIRGHKTAALYPVPALAAIGRVPVAAQQREHEGHGRRRGRGRAGRPTRGAHHAPGRDGEGRQPPAAARHPAFRCTAAGTLLQGGGVARHRERAQQEGIENEAGSVLGVAKGAQPADQEQQLAQRGLLLHRGEPLGRLQHRHAGGVARVVPSQRLAVRPYDLCLRDDVQRAARVQHQVDVGERLQPGAEPRLGPADALGHGADPPAGAAEDGDDPVRLTQLLRPQHYPVVPVELHLPILPHGRDNQSADGSSPWDERRAGARLTSMPPITATPVMRMRGAPGAPGPSPPWSTPPITPNAPTSTSASSGTVISMPPITATALITVLASANEASRMSSLIPPSVATAVYSGGTTHWPSRLAPPRMASESLNRGVPPILRRAGAVSCVAGRSRVTGTRSAKVLALYTLVSRSSSSSTVIRPWAWASRSTSAAWSRSMSDMRKSGRLSGESLMRSTLAIMSDHEAIRRGRPCERSRRIAGRAGRAESAEAASAAAGSVHRGQDRAHRGRDRVRVDADAPEHAAADLALHVRGGLGIGAGGQRVLVVIEHPRVHADRGQRVAERRDRAVAYALDLLRVPLNRDLRGEDVLGLDHRRCLVVQQRHRAGGEVLSGEDLPHLPGGHLAALVVGVALDHPGELDLQAAGQVRLMLGR